MPRSETAPVRKQRANGVQSRHRILDAAVQIAGERGYEGTSISAVSGACGLPASSIYWHFKDKDDLIAAVIERSFEVWLAAVELPDEGTGTDRERVEGMAASIATSLLAAPDFLRLGLMLALERRPVEPRGRTVFLSSRGVTGARLVEVVTELVPGLTANQVRLLTTYAVAAADGLFVAHEIDDGTDLVGLFRLHARTVLALAVDLASTNPASTNPTPPSSRSADER